jgi:four helix bundle protein
MFENKEQLEKLRNWTFRLASKIIYVHKDIVLNFNDSVLVGHLLKNGTNIGEHIVDASQVKVRYDFNYYIMKTQQSIERTKYWLGLLHESSFVSSETHDSLMNDIRQIERFIQENI